LKNENIPGSSFYAFYKVSAYGACPYKAKAREKMEQLKTLLNRKESL
jgi:hypothetical protein